MHIELEPIRKNFNKVTLGRLDIWFSYKTVVAVKFKDILLVAKNQWGPATGTHLNLIDPSQEHRVTLKEIEDVLFDLTLEMFEIELIDSLQKYTV